MELGLSFIGLWAVILGCVCVFLFSFVFLEPS
jgi:hypothetical protein